MEHDGTDCILSIHLMTTRMLEKQREQIARFKRHQQINRMSYPD